jgi:hypothetical protein
MATVEAPHNKPDLSRSSSSELHRRTRHGLHALPFRSNINIEPFAIYSKNECPNLPT